MNAPVMHPTILQKQNEEKALEKIKEANLKLENIKKQCNEAKAYHNTLQIELQKSKVKECHLNELIKMQSEKEIALKTECERIAKEYDDIFWKKKVINAKYEMEKTNRRFYENVMKTSGEVSANFMNTDEYQQNINHEKEMENLRKRTEDLKHLISEKQVYKANCEKKYSEMEQSQKLRSEKLQLLEKSLTNLENLIQKQNDELETLLRS